MIITCPHALGLAIPLVLVVSTVLFDKTGTLTTGTFEVTSVDIHDGNYAQEQGLERHDKAGNKGGGTRIFILVDEAVTGSIALSGTTRPESYQAIKALHKWNINCWMLTGDNEETAKAVADELGMDGYFAEVLPDEKQAREKELQNQGEYVAMTGDGVNDSPALAQAQIGIAVGSGTYIAAPTADIILVNSNPLDITTLIVFGRAT